MAFFEASPQQSVLSQPNSYKSVGALLMDLQNTVGGIASSAKELLTHRSGDELQKGDLFFKTHIMDMGSSSMDPQREWLYMLYIGDVKGRFWNDVGLNYANFGQQLMDHMYGVANASIKTAVYMGLIDLIKTAGKTGTTSSQQELIYRLNTFTMPTRNVDSVTTYFMGSKNNQPVNVSYQGELGCTFEEGEDAFILRQFNSWMSVMDEASAAKTELGVSSAAGVSNSGGVADIASKMKSGIEKLKGVANPMASAPLDVDISLAKSMKTDIDLFMFRYSGEDVCYKVTFYGCYPTSIGGAQWSYSGNAAITYSVNFAYDYFKIHYIRSPLRPRVHKLKTWLAQTINQSLQNIVTQMFIYMYRAVAKKATMKLWDKTQSPEKWPVERKNTHDEALNAAKINMILPTEKIEGFIDALSKKINASNINMINPSDESWTPEIDKEGNLKYKPTKDDGNDIKGPIIPLATKENISKKGDAENHGDNIRPYIKPKDNTNDTKVTSNGNRLDLVGSFIPGPIVDQNGVKGPNIPLGNKDNLKYKDIDRVKDVTDVNGPNIPLAHKESLTHKIDEINKGSNIQPFNRDNNLLNDLLNKIRKS